MTYILGKAAEQIQRKMVAEEPVVESDSLACTECDFIAKAKVGLIGHMRKHQGEEA